MGFHRGLGKSHMPPSTRLQGPDKTTQCFTGQMCLPHRKSSRRAAVQTCSSATLERPATSEPSTVSQNGYVRPSSAGSDGISNGHTRTSPRGVCITTHNLVKEFSTSNGRHLAVDHLSTRFQPDKMVALLGPSGSGKTTLLRMIAGLESTSSGQIMFDDQDATHLSVQDRGVGFVFQSYALFKHMTLAENIAFGPRTRKLDMDVDARVNQLLEMVKLPGQGHRYPMQLSGGQRQRIALARALAVNPRLLLLDEPFGALDPMAGSSLLPSWVVDSSASERTRTELRRDMKAILNEVGITSILVTHDQEEAFDIADQVAVFNRGKIQQLGTPEEIKQSPINPFVAWFTDLNINTLPSACSFVRRMGLKSDKPLVMVKASAVRLYTGASEAEAVQQGHVPAVIRDIIDTGLQARCFLMFEDGAEVEMHLDGRLHQRPMEVELQQKVYVRVEPQDFTTYSPSDISTQPVIEQ